MGDAKNGNFAIFFRLDFFAFFADFFTRLATNFLVGSRDIAIGVTISPFPCLGRVDLDRQSRQGQALRVIRPLTALSCQGSFVPGTRLISDIRFSS